MKLKKMEKKQKKLQEGNIDIVCTSFDSKKI